MPLFFAINIQLVLTIQTNSEIYSFSNTDIWTMNEKKAVVSFLWILGQLFFTYGLYAQTKKNDKDIRRNQDAQSVFIDATKADMLENYKEAISLYKKATELDPENATAFYKLGDIYIKQNQYAEALPFAKKAVELDSKNLYFWLQLAQLQELNADFSGAIKSFEQIIKSFEGNEIYRLSIAQLYVKSKKYKNAIKELSKAEQTMGPSPEIFQIRQKLYLQDGKLDKARLEGTKWIEAFPNDPQPRFAYVQFLMSNNQNQEAKNVLNQLLVLFPGFPAANLMLADIYINEKDEVNADLQIEKAFANPELPIGAKIDLVASYLRGISSKSDEERALKLCELIIQSHPQDPKGYIIKGDIFNKLNRKIEARDMYILAKSKDKNNFGLWEQIVLIDLNFNEIDSLIKHTSDAKTLFPNTPSFSFYNGMANLMKKEYAKAIEALEQAKRISLENRDMQLEIYSQLGDAYYNLKDFEKSNQAFDNALALDSNNGHVLNNYSYFLSLEKSNLGKALKMSSKLILQFPDDATYLDTHGWVLFQNGDFTTAASYLEKAAKNSNSGVVWEHYGDALFKINKQKEAVEAWKRAKELGTETSDQLEKKLKDKRL